MFRLLIDSILLSLVAPRAPYTPPAIPHLDGRIVGGNFITIDKRPFQTSLQYNGRHICGASIITASHVLTAAHCTNKIPSNSLSVRAGSSYREYGGQVIGVKRICQNINYNPAIVDNDVSVLIMKTPFQLGSGIQPVKLQPVKQEVPVGALATVSGWGTTSEGGTASSVLLEVSLPRVKDSACKRVYGYGSITSRMTCYGYRSGGKDSCQGDSGGPLVYKGLQVGVVSWGYGCAKPGYPGVYTKLSESSIANHIAKCLRYNSSNY